MAGLFDGTSLERPVTCERCEKPLRECKCPRDAKGELTTPQDQQARVSRERRGGGKLVTLISGLDPIASDLPALLKQFKVKCATGGTIQDGRIELQGDHREKILAALRQLGYPAKLSGG